jgi:hypothetical protein
MTTAADDSAAEDAFEALLAGRPAPEGAAGLAAFTEAVRTSANRPGRPSAALAELLATGLLTDQSSPSIRTARTAGSPPARSSRVRIRRRAAMIFPVLLAKFLSAGAVAQAATGAGLVLVVATGAGATGALGENVQDTVTSVVGVTSEDATGDATGDATVGGEDVTSETETTPVVETTAPADPTEGQFDPEAWAAAGPEGYSSFGAWVSESAHNRELKDWLRAEGRNFGSMVREWAHKKGLDDADLADEGVDLDELTDVSTTEPVSGETASEPETEDAGTQVTTTERVSGNGNGNGKSAGVGSNGKGNGNGNGSGNGKAQGNGHGGGR